jgi:hypothetical protein
MHETEPVLLADKPDPDPNEAEGPRTLKRKAYERELHKL